MSMPADKVSSDVSYATSGLLTIFGLTLNEWVAVVGIVLGIGTFCVNWYYRHKLLQLEKSKADK